MRGSNKHLEDDSLLFSQQKLNKPFVDELLFLFNVKPNQLPVVMSLLFEGELLIKNILFSDQLSNVEEWIQEVNEYKHEAYYFSQKEEGLKEDEVVGLNFKNKVMLSDKPVLLLGTKNNCVNCEKLTEIFDLLAVYEQSKFKLLRMNIDENEYGSFRTDEFGVYLLYGKTDKSLADNLRFYSEVEDKFDLLKKAKADLKEILEEEELMADVKDEL